MKIVITGEFPEAAQALIRASFPPEWDLRILQPEAVEGELTDADVLIPEHLAVDAALLEKAPRLKLVQTGAGYDNVDVLACTRRGVQVCNAAGINADAVAEHVMAFILCWYKNLLYLDGFMKAGRPEAELAYTGAELSDKTVGLIGLGHVGQRVAARCRAFGMRVLGWSYRPCDLPGVERCDLDRLLCESDVVSLHIPLNADTRHTIDAAALRKMKPDALLINTSRGGVVNEADLIEALRRGTIGGACLDVYEEEPLPVGHPLRSLDRVLLTPHTAGLPDGVKFHKKRYAFFVSNIDHVLRNEPPESRLNTLL